MKQNIHYFFLLSIAILFHSCQNEPVSQQLEPAGYIDYQYNYKITENNVEVTRQGYKRFRIAEVAYAFYEQNNLDTSFVKNGFRKVELYFYSKECNTDSINQPLGASWTQVSLIDTIGTNQNTDRVLPYAYQIENISRLEFMNKPFCTGIVANLNFHTDNLTNTNKYEYSFNGQVGRKFNVVKIGNMYQITGYGMWNSKNYTIYYLGNIRRKTDIKSN